MYELRAWCSKNHLTVHTGKREAIILSNANFVGPLKPVIFGNIMIKYVTESTSLGVKIDSKINWKSHLTKVTNSFNSKFKEMRRLNLLPIKTHEEIYFKTVVSSMTYCISVLGTSSYVIMDAIDNLHGRVARDIHKLKDRTLTN